MSATSSSSDNESVTLVDEVPLLASELENVESTASTTKAESESKKDEIKVLVDKPGYHKEIRTNAKGRRYEVETEGLWTTVRSLDGRRGRSKPYIQRLTKRFTEFKTFWPFLLRFAKEVIKLGRWRFVFHLISSFVMGLVPALRMYLSARLISIAQAASEKRILRKTELFTVAATSYLSSFLETWIYNLQSSNNGIMSRRFEDMINTHLMQARSRLDIQTLNKQRVIKDFASAGSLVHALGDGTFVVNQLIDLFTSAMSLLAQAKVLWNMTTRDNADLAMVSAFSSSLLLLRVRADFLPNLAACSNAFPVAFLPVPYVGNGHHRPQLQQNEYHEPYVASRPVYIRRKKGARFRPVGAARISQGIIRSWRCLFVGAVLSRSVLYCCM